MWQKAVIVNLKYYPDIYLQGLRKAMTKLSQDNGSLG
jgi:hypothetical protein